MVKSVDPLVQSGLTETFGGSIVFLQKNCQPILKFILLYVFICCALLLFNIFINFINIY